MKAIFFALCTFVAVNVFAQETPVNLPSSNKRCDKAYLIRALASEYKVWAQAKADPALADGRVVTIHMVEDPKLHEWGVIAKGRMECDLAQGSSMSAVESVPSSQSVKVYVEKSYEVREPLPQLTASLATFGEVEIRIGDRGVGGPDVNKIHWFANTKTGTWSIVESTPTGFAYLMAWGSDFEIKD